MTTYPSLQQNTTDASLSFPLPSPKTTTQWTLNQMGHFNVQQETSSINLAQSLLLELILGTAAVSVDALKAAAVAHAQVCAPSLSLA